MATQIYPAQNIIVAGVATEAKQDAQIALLTTIDADTSALVLKDFATSAKQDTGNSSLTSIDGKFTTLNAKDFATSAKQDTGNSSLSSIDGKFTTLNAKDFATSAKQDTGNTSLGNIDTKLPSTLGAKTSALSLAVTLPTDIAALSVTTTAIGVIDQIDTTPLLSCASTNIPASSGNPLTIVASLAANCKKIVSVEDIGEYIGLYTGVALSEVLYCILPLGGGEIEVNIPAATRISLRAMKNVAIATDYIAINFLG